MVLLHLIGSGPNCNSLVWVLSYVVDSLCYGGLSVTSEFNFFKTFHHTVLPMSPTPYEVGEDTYTALHDGKQL